MDSMKKKVKDFFTNSDFDLNGDPLDDTAEGITEPTSTPRSEKRNAKTRPNLVTVPSKTKNGDNLEIVLFKASCYEDMQAIARHIKERKVAVVNFEGMDKDVAQRMVDFLSGATFALDGVPRKVSGGTFIFSSSQVDVSGQIMERGTDFEAEDFTSDSRFSSNHWLNN